MVGLATPLCVLDQTHTPPGLQSAGTAQAFLFLSRDICLPRSSNRRGAFGFISIFYLLSCLRMKNFLDSTKYDNFIVIANHYEKREKNEFKTMSKSTQNFFIIFIKP